MLRRIIRIEEENLERFGGKGTFSSAFWNIVINFLVVRSSIIPGGG